MGFLGKKGKPVQMRHLWRSSAVSYNGKLDYSRDPSYALFDSIFRTTSPRPRECSTKTKTIFDFFCRTIPFFSSLIFFHWQTLYTLFCLPLVDSILMCTIYMATMVSLYKVFSSFYPFLYLNILVLMAAYVKNQTERASDQNCYTPKPKRESMFQLSILLCGIFTLS